MFIRRLIVYRVLCLNSDCVNVLLFNKKISEDTYYWHDLHSVSSMVNVQLRSTSAVCCLPVFGEHAQYMLHLKAALLEIQIINKLDAFGYLSVLWASLFRIGQGIICSQSYQHRVLKFRKHVEIFINSSNIAATNKVANANYKLS